MAVESQRRNRRDLSSKKLSGARFRLASVNRRVARSPSQHTRQPSGAPNETPAVEALISLRPAHQMQPAIARNGKLLRACFLVRIRLRSISRQRGRLETLPRFPRLDSFARQTLARCASVVSNK